MADSVERTGSSRLWQLLLGSVVVVILAYALLTANILLGTLTAAVIVLGYHIVRWLAELTRLFRRLVVALERIAEHS